MSVLVAKPEAHRAAVVKLHPPGALHLEEERIDGIVDPDEFVAGQRVTVRDLAAARVRHHPLALQLAAQPQAGEFRVDRRKIDDQQIRRHSVNRRDVTLAACPAAAQQRLVVARHQSGVACIELFGSFQAT